MQSELITIHKIEDRKMKRCSECKKVVARKDLGKCKDHICRCGFPIGINQDPFKCGVHGKIMQSRYIRKEDKSIPEMLNIKPRING